MLELALGQAGYKRQKSEENNKIFRRSIYFVKDLPKGHVIKKEDIRRIRPGNGISPKNFEKILGKKILKKVFRGSTS